MARKEYKLRPYRVDFFDIEEMIFPDMALIQSVVVRAVTSAQAHNMVLLNDLTAHGDGTFVEGRVVIRAYRFYKKLGVRKKKVYKAIEELFPVNKAIKVMDSVEIYRRSHPLQKLDRSSGVMNYENIVNSTTLSDEEKSLRLEGWRQRTPGTSSIEVPAKQEPSDSNGHQTRFSDSSLYDEVCVNCGATDAQPDKLNQPCPDAPTLPTSGSESPATIAVVNDLQGMIAHDTHEQLMDTFVPTAIPEGKRLPTGETSTLQEIRPGVYESETIPHKVDEQRIKDIINQTLKVPPDQSFAANADEAMSAELKLLRSTSPAAPEFGDEISSAVAGQSPADRRSPSTSFSTTVAVIGLIAFLSLLGWFLSCAFHH